MDSSEPCGFGHTDRLTNGECAPCRAEQLQRLLAGQVMTSLQRWWRKVVPAPSGCWLWSGANNGRYPRFCFGGRDGYAHRFSFEAFVGPTAEGLYVCHHCDVPLCVNPAHLFLGTAAESVANCAAKGRLNNAAKASKGLANGRAKLSEAQVYAIRSSNRPAAMLSREFRISVNCVRNVQRLKRWPHLPDLDPGSDNRHRLPSARGEANGTAKLTEAKVLAIRLDARPQPEIAADYGISRSNVGLIKRRQSWSWLA